MGQQMQMWGINCKCIILRWHVSFIQTVQVIASKTLTTAVQGRMWAIDGKSSPSQRALQAGDAAIHTFSLQHLTDDV